MTGLKSEDVSYEVYLKTAGQEIKKGERMVTIVGKKEGIYSKKVGLKLGRTVNVGNYESVRIDAWLEVQIKEDDPVEEAYNDVYSVVSDAISGLLKDPDSTVS